MYSLTERLGLKEDGLGRGPSPRVDGKRLEEEYPLVGWVPVSGVAATE